MPGIPRPPRNSGQGFTIDFTIDEDADLADELLAGFEEGVAWL